MSIQQSSKAFEYYIKATTSSSEGCKLETLDISSCIN